MCSSISKMYLNPRLGQACRFLVVSKHSHGKFCRNHQVETLKYLCSGSHYQTEQSSFCRTFTSLKTHSNYVRFLTKPSSFLSVTSTSCDSHILRGYSTNISDPKQVPQVEEEDDDDVVIPTKDEHGKPLSNWQRMKLMAKMYGYVIIPVHWVIAPVWFGTFYYAIKMGVDIGPMLHTIGVSDHHIESLQNSRASTAVMAYALYKIFTPLRYTLTLGATEFTIRFLRRRGFIKPVPKKLQTYRQSIKDTYSEVKDRLKKDES